ncbi:hypothetical protein BKA56DRAFT_588890 [Ilyonectria sp. MPI-CAGE-AT-0026]|nr:hypothetical protein BKA56DRAFT_588890 [Ilyonectria sp. MPI-CAGE-AT-0026]
MPSQAELAYRTAPHRTTPFSPPLRKMPPRLSPHSHSPAIARLQPAPDASSQKGTWRHLHAAEGVVAVALLPPCCWR